MYINFFVKLRDQKLFVHFFFKLQSGSKNNTRTVDAYGFSVCTNISKIKKEKKKKEYNTICFFHLFFSSLIVLKIINNRVRARKCFVRYCYHHHRAQVYSYLFPYILMYLLLILLRAGSRLPRKIAYSRKRMYTYTICSCISVESVKAFVYTLCT